MTRLRQRPASRPRSLEHEVLTAVVVLYLVICAALLLVHYVQPDRAPHDSSSPLHQPAPAVGRDDRGR